MLEIYTDGACLTNPGGASSWAAVFVFRGQETAFGEIMGIEEGSTNNRGEMLAAIHALTVVSDLGYTLPIEIWSDSEYLVKGASVWAPRWNSKGSLEGHKNADLWAQILNLCASIDVKWGWVRGHNGHKWNERADYLCDMTIREFVKKYPEKNLTTYQKAGLALPASPQKLKPKVKVVRRRPPTKKSKKRPSISRQADLNRLNEIKRLRAAEARKYK